MLSRLIKEPHPLYNISFDSDSLFHGINLKTTQAPIRNRMAPSTEDSALSLITPSPNATTAFLAVQSSFLAVATLSVLARFYVRSTIIKNIGLDDIFIVIGLVDQPIHPRRSDSLTKSGTRFCCLCADQRYGFLRSTTLLSAPSRSGFRGLEHSG